MGRGVVSAASAQSRRGPLEPGTQVGRYQLLRRLARGGMAELYLARADGLHGFRKLCVLKLVLPHLAEDRRFVEMFLHEARMAATLDHPNIVHVTDIGELDGEPYMVMQYVRGRDVRQIAKARSGAPLPLDVAVTISTQVAAGLHHVHEQRGPDGAAIGLVHRDVSPANVMIGFDGNAKLVDFGIAKSTEQLDATRTGVIKGKVSYMAPEQCRGRRIDRRTDVFALGILLYEMTTGRRLFPGDTDFAVMSKIVDGVYVRPREVDPEYPPGLEAIIVRALQLEPEDRYPTAAEVQSEIEAFARQSDLRVSPLTLSKFMLDTFGEQPNAASQDPLEEARTEILADGGSAPSGPSAGILPSLSEDVRTRIGGAEGASIRGGSNGALTGIVHDSSTEVAAYRGGTMVAGPSSETEVAAISAPTWTPPRTGRWAVAAIAGVAVVGGLTFGAMNLSGSDAGDAGPAVEKKAPAPPVNVPAQVPAEPTIAPAISGSDPPIDSPPPVESGAAEVRPQPSEKKSTTSPPAEAAPKKKRRRPRTKKPKVSSAKTSDPPRPPRRKIDELYPD